MLKSLTMRSFPSEMPWQECLRESRSSGFGGVEVNFDGVFPLDCPTRLLSEIKKTATQCDIEITSVYSRLQWLSPISSPDLNKREEGLRVIRRLLDIAEKLEASTVLTIPGAVDNSLITKDSEIVPYDEVYDRVLEGLTDLSETARRRGVVLALENVANKFLLSPLEMRDLIDKTGSPFVGCHFDVANCLYCGGYPEQWINILGKRIKVIHLKDFKLAAGNLTGFTNIFEGDVDWKQVCNALAKTGYDGPLISEVLPAYKHHPEILWKNASQAMDRIVEDIQRLHAKARKTGGTS